MAIGRVDRPRIEGHTTINRHSDRQIGGAMSLEAKDNDPARMYPAVVSKATSVFGDGQVAIAWMTSPVMGLDQRRPIDLLATAQGAEIVEDFLNRIDKGVYS